MHHSFGKLLRRYRTRAGLTTLNALADALAETGYECCPTVLSRWQNNQRFPQERTVLLLVVALFIQKGGMRTLSQINEFTEAAGHGYITQKEWRRLLHEGAIEVSQPTYTFDQNPYNSTTATYSDIINP